MSNVKWLLCVFSVAALVAFAWRYADESVPGFESVRLSYRPSDVVILDRNELPLDTIRSEKSYRSLDWVTLAEVSPLFLQILVRAEDKRFFGHSGVDAVAILSAIRDSVETGRIRGASTLTMQLVKEFAARGVVASQAVGKTVLGKFVQGALAIVLEMNWSKTQILEAYVNLASYRGELKGLRAAAYSQFDRTPLALGKVESAILVAQLRSPNIGTEKLKERVRFLLRHEEGVNDLEQRVEDSVHRPVAFQMRTRSILPIMSAKIFRNVKPSVGSESVAVLRTSIDRRYQELAIEAVRNQLTELARQNVNDAAVLVLNTRTGEPLVYVGNGGPGFSSAWQIDGVLQRRQMGSTMKPFLYATAFEIGLLDPSTPLMDSPEEVSVGQGQVYRPRNYDGTFRGAVSAGEALASSLNVPAVRTLMMTNEARVIERLRALGFSALQYDEFYGPSLALGTVDASLWDLTEAFRRLSEFADDKTFSLETKRKIFSSLAVPEYRRLSFGLGSLLELPFPAAVKTGTSKDMRDNWCVGYTSEYTVGVWVGNFTGAPMWNVSGMSGAAPTWRRLMLELHGHRTPVDQVIPFAKIGDVVTDNPGMAPAIRYPVNEMLVGIDPDIPHRNQKIRFEFSGSSNDLSRSKVYLNSQLLGTASQTAFWSPVVGRHVIELRHDGVTVDRVRFKVR